MPLLLCVFLIFDERWCEEDAITFLRCSNRFVLAGQGWGSEGTDMWYEYCIVEGFLARVQRLIGTEWYGAVAKPASQIWDQNTQNDQRN